ncbi:MAG: hypothetical protein FJW31_24720 [Acidobacteria bacterium]|nr:hypothetical protein [Acidobacteriota bacterium]
MNFCESEESLAAFIRGFEDGTFPKTQWTHQAHVVMASHYLTLHLVAKATRIVRERIPAYNVAQGGVNTADSGYHETLTVFWIAVVAAFLAAQPPGTPRLAIIHAAAEHYAGESRLHQRYYGYNVMADSRARREWVPPPAWV